jgi:hypothetical protein
MSTPLLNCFIFVCKLMICISIFLSIGTHHWIRDYDGEEHRGIEKIFFRFIKDLIEWC